MRKAINENQVVQVALIAILLVVVGFLFMTRIAGGGEEAAPPATTTPTSEAAAPATAAEAPPTQAPSPDPAVSGGGEEFTAGPGLPKAVAAAYDSGETIVLLVVRGRGIDDAKVEQQLRARAGVDAAVFVTRAKEIAKYSRIAQGVDVDRVPALVVIQPKRLADGPLPEATVGYGYRGAGTIEQAIRDAGYKGPSDLPYHPN